MDDRKYVKRRRVPRREYDGLVGVLHRGNYEICNAVQIGEGGLLLKSMKKMEMGDRLVLTLKPPGVEQTVVQSVVRFVTEDKDVAGGWKYGVEFLNLEFQAKRQIRGFVASKREADYTLSEYKVTEHKKTA